MSPTGFVSLSQDVDHEKGKQDFDRGILRDEREATGIISSDCPSLNYHIDYGELLLILQEIRKKTDGHVDSVNTDIKV